MASEPARVFRFSGKGKESGAIDLSARRWKKGDAAAAAGFFSLNRYEPLRNGRYRQSGAEGEDEGEGRA